MGFATEIKELLILSRYFEPPSAVAPCMSILTFVLMGRVSPTHLLDSNIEL
jgi:hypothetical protein